MKNPRTFPEVVMHCFADPDLMREYRRLTGATLGASRTVIERMIDDATGSIGLDEREAIRFIAFVKDVVWDRLPADAFEVSDE